MAVTRATASTRERTSSNRSRVTRRGHGRCPPSPLCVRDSWPARRHILPGASKDPDFDIAQNQATQHVTENAFSARFDYKCQQQLVLLRAGVQRFRRQPGPAGRHRPVFRNDVQAEECRRQPAGHSGPSLINEFKFGYNAANSTEVGIAPAGFEALAINLTGSVANTGIAGQGGSTGVALPGGLVRVNSFANGRSAPYNPYSLTFADSVTQTKGNHYVKYRRRHPGHPHEHGPAGRHHLQLLESERLPEQHTGHRPVLRRLERAEPLPQRRHGAEAQRAGILCGVCPGRMACAAELHPELRSSLRLLHGDAGGRQPDREVQHHTGQLDPDTTPFFQSKKDNFQPRVSATFSPTPRTVLKSGVRHLRGPRPDGGSDSAHRSRTHRHVDFQWRLSRQPGRHSSELHGQPQQQIVLAARLFQRLHASREGLPVHGGLAAGSRRKHGSVGGLRRRSRPQPLSSKRLEPDDCGGHERRVGGHSNP